MGWKKEKNKQASYVKAIADSNMVYRNAKQRKNKGKFTEKLLGGAILYNVTSQLKIGVQFLRHNYNLPFQIGEKPTTQHNQWGLFGEWKNSIHNTVAEIAISSTKEIATIIAHKITPGKNDKITIMAKHYSPHFHSPHGDKNKNQQNLILAWDKKIKPITLTNAFILHRQKKMKKNTQENHNKLMHECTIDYKVNKNFSWGSRIKTTYHQGKNELIASTKTYFTWIWKKITIKSILGITHDLSQLSIGFCQNIIYSLQQLKITLHYTFFRSQKQPLYFYTPDIKSPSFPKLLGTGIRLGVILSYTLQKYLVCQLQVYTTYNHTKNTTSTTYKCQLSYNL